MKGEVEHANINVRNLDDTVLFLTTALPNFKVRYREQTAGCIPWLHIGSDSTYLALNQLSQDIDSQDFRFNHLGFVVDDAEEVKNRCLNAGYKEGYIDKPNPYRKRVYILDKEGMEWEFVEYLSDDPAKRNDYSDA